MSALGAIFVGGASRRMGGLPKGRLVAPSGAMIVARLRDLFVSLGIPSCLVGDASAYGDVGLGSIADAAPASGPLGGLVAALAMGDPLIAIACDLPRVPREVLARLLAASDEEAIVAPVVDAIAQPLCARYDARRVLPAARARLERGALSLQGLLTEVGYAALPLAEGEADLLGDWDAPADVARDR